MERFRFFLDGNQISNEPKGWEDAELNLERSKEISGLLLKYSSKLTFFGDAYTYIKSQYDSNGFCELIEIEILHRCGETPNFDFLFKGVIFMTEVIFDHQRCQVECQIQDDSYSARIQNNKNMKAKITVGRSKNDIAITPAAYSDIFVYSLPSVSLAEHRRMFSAFECFRFLIEFMTDGIVGFVSDYFTTGEGKILFVTTGNCIRFDQSWNGTTPTIFPDISFKETFEEINKRFPISFAVETIGAKKYIRIENKDYFFSNSPLMTLENVPNIKEQIDSSELYSSVKLGSPSVFTPSTQEIDPVRFLTWEEEEYNTVGECNIDNTLDLQGKWLVNSNVFKDIINNGDDSHDEEIILACSSDGITLDFEDIFPPLEYLCFNVALTNKNVATRWLGAIPNSIAKYLGNGNDTFVATNDSSTGYVLQNVPIDPIQFDHELLDPNNNYDPANFRYVAPSNGLYTFYVQIAYNLKQTYFGSPFLGQARTVAIKINTYDSSNTFITSYTVGFNHPSPGETNSVQHFSDSYTFPAIFLSQNDRARVSVELSAVNLMPIVKQEISVDALGEFRCVTAQNGGGIYQPYEPKDFKNIGLSFEYPLRYSAMKTLMNSPEQYITVTGAYNFYSQGWIDLLKYKIRNGLGNFKLRKSINK